MAVKEPTQRFDVPMNDLAGVNELESTECSTEELPCDVEAILEGPILDRLPGGSRRCSTPFG